MAPEPPAKVIIVGAGPVGLLTALRLAKTGVQVDVIEKESALNEAPRACSYYAGALHAFQRAGVLDDIQTAGFSTAGLCWREPLADGDNGEKRLGSILACLPVMGTNDWDTGVLNLQQAKLTKLLYHKTQETNLVSVHFERELTAIEHDSQSVTATATRPDGSHQRFHGSFLVGADGGRSATRKLLGIRFKGHTWPQRFVAIDVSIKDLEYHERFASSLVVDPIFFALISPLERPQSGTPGLWRCTVAVDPNDPRTDEELVSEENLDRLLTRIIPGPRPLIYQVARASPYRVHQLCASTFTRGRCSLAGDAAHLNNPMGAMGLTTGILDSEALADALELMIHEQVSPDALTRYSDERRRVFQTFVDPLSTQNMLRCASDVETAKEDWFIRLMAKATPEMARKGTEPFFHVWRTNIKQTLGIS